jgi:hypothetical protein
MISKAWRLANAANRGCCKSHIPNNGRHFVHASINVILDQTT